MSLSSSVQPHTPSSWHMLAVQAVQGASGASAPSHVGACRGCTPCSSCSCGTRGTTSPAPRVSRARRGEPPWPHLDRRLLLRLQRGVDVRLPLAEGRVGQVEGGACARRALRGRNQGAARPPRCSPPSRLCCACAPGCPGGAATARSASPAPSIARPASQASGQSEPPELSGAPLGLCRAARAAPAGCRK